MVAQLGEEIRTISASNGQQDLPPQTLPPRWIHWAALGVQPCVFGTVTVVSDTLVLFNSASVVRSTNERKWSQFRYFLFFSPWKSQNDRMKGRCEQSKTEVSNRSERKKHNGNQRKRGRGTLAFPPAPKMKGFFSLLPVQKGNESVSFSQREQDEAVDGAELHPVLPAPSPAPPLPPPSFSKGHKVSEELLSPFQGRRSHTRMSATGRPQMSRPNKACCILQTKSLKIKRTES